MPRLTPVTTPNQDQQAALDKTLHGPDGKPLNLFLTLAREVELMRRVNALGGYFAVVSPLDPKHREIAILRTAGVLECPYEIAQHVWIAKRVGLTDRDIEAAVDPSRAAIWPVSVRAVLELVSELANDRRVSDEVWCRSVQELGENRCMDLVLLVGFYRMLADFILCAGIELDSSVCRSTKR